MDGDEVLDYGYSDDEEHEQERDTGMAGLQHSKLLGSYIYIYIYSQLMYICGL